MPNILVVDDDPEIRIMLGYALNQSGYTVSVAKNGREALEQCTKSLPQVMLLDLMMPDISGWEVLSEMHKLGQHERCNVVIISAHLKGVSDDLIAKGAKQCLPKPFDLNTLLGLVKRLMEPPTAPALVPVTVH